MRRIRDSAHRAALRLGYPVLRAWWFVTRPSVEGVKCVLKRGDDVLLVRHTYGQRTVWDLPGGGLRRGESAVAAARREVREEVGVDVADWRELRPMSVPVDHRRNTLHGVVADAGDSSPVADRVEIAEVRWFSGAKLPPKLTPWVRPMVGRALGCGYKPDVVEAVVIRKYAGDGEAERLLDELELIVGLHGEPVDDGRRYDLTESRDWVIAIASMEGQLEKISAAWRDHLRFEPE
jgi:8-oxo-dGTP pyrophosphatase MutT (NUDIX family)